MAQKGPKIKLDIPALEAIIVAAARLASSCHEKATSIRQTCLSMESEESLTGGEGDTLRECFANVSKGISNIESSIDYTVKNLNASLDKTIQMQRGRMAGSLQEDTAAATNKAGVFKKD